MDEKYLNLQEAICDGDDEAALEAVDALLEDGVNPLSIFTECVEPTLNELGEQFAKLEIFLPDLVLAEGRRRHRHGFGRYSRHRQEHGRSDDADQRL